MDSRGGGEVGAQDHVRTCRPGLACSLIVMAACCVLSCSRVQEVELVSDEPNGKNQIRLLRERKDIASKPYLVIEAISNDSRVRLDSVRLSQALGDGSLHESFEVGICLAEVTWPDRQTAVVLVRNCLGHVTLVSYEFSRGQLEPGVRFKDSMRAALLARYQRELKDVRQDPLEWINRRDATAAYQSRQIGGGRLMK